MPGKRIKLTPEDSAQSCFESYKDLGIVVPNGIGLQVLFKVENEYYVIAGPRGGSIMSLNGGKVEDQQSPLFNQIAEEYEEETFGKMQVMPAKDGYKLLLNGSIHNLKMQNDYAHVSYETGDWAYAYVSLTAVCETATLDELKDLAATISPTANYWSKIGNYLFTHRKAPKDDAEFATYWASKTEERKALIATLVSEYNSKLLIDPKDVFQASTVEEALDNLNKIATYNDYKKMFEVTVGRYSERASYSVFLASELGRAAQPGCEDKNVKDIEGKVISTRGIFNDDYVSEIPAILRTLAVQTPVSAGKFSMFTRAATSEAQEEQLHTSLMKTA